MRKEEYERKRYEYILNQIRDLNQYSHRYLSVFQALLSATIGGGVALFVSWRNLGLTPSDAVLAIHSLLAVATVLSVFFLAASLAVMRSWWHYRLEEVELVNDAVGPNTRQPPRLKNLWRWQESWFLVLVLLVLASLWIFAEALFIPRIVG